MTLDLPFPVPPDEVADLRHQLAAAQALARVRGENLVAAAKHLGELRCQTAELCDTTHSSVPFPPDGLKRYTARLASRADTASRLAAGYAAVSESDLVCPNIADDLRAYGWDAVPDRTLDGTTPPASPAERARRRSDANDKGDGYRRGWTRTTAGRPDEQIVLWFTSKNSLKYAWASTVGRLHELHEVSAVVRSEAGLITGTGSLPRGFRWPDGCDFFDGYGTDHVRRYVKDQGWTLRDEYPCDGHGNRRSTGRYHGSIWCRPNDPTFRLYIWGERGQPARVGYWAGAIRHPAQLGRLINR